MIRILALLLLCAPFAAAQQAERRGDVAAAARFYSRTLARDGENAHLLERAMLNQLAAGNINEGIALARRQEALNPGHHLGVLALAADALQRPGTERVAELLGEALALEPQAIDKTAYFLKQLVRARKAAQPVKNDNKAGQPAQNTTNHEGV